MIFYDLETTNKIKENALIIQIAAAVVDPSTWETGETFERKLEFDPAEADPEALERNSYDPEVWAREAVEPEEALRSFGRFLHCHKTETFVSQRTGRPFKVAQLAGHNITGYDDFILRGAWDHFKLGFFPASFQGLDTLQAAIWWRLTCNPYVENLKLETLAKHFGCLEDGAHDALVDVRMSIGVAQGLVYDLGSECPICSKEMLIICSKCHSETQCTRVEE